MAGFRAAEAVIVADGQSLNFTPIPYVDNWPMRVSDDLNLVRPVDVWIGGTGWYTLLGTQTQRTRPYAHAALNTIYTLCGGTTDVAAGHAAADIYADMVTTADNARGLGYDHVIATTITPWSGWAGGSAPEIQRLAANALILDDADEAFDSVADFAGTTGLHDPTNGSYYADGLHFTALAAQLAADTISPHLLAVL